MFRNQVDPKFDDKKKLIIKKFRVICLKIYIINCIYERTEILSLERQVATILALKPKSKTIHNVPKI